MTNKEKAEQYDNLIRENDILTSKISHLKSTYSPNIPDNIQRDINELEYKISQVVGKLESLFKA